MIATPLETFITVQTGDSFGSGEHPSTALMVELLHDLQAHGLHPHTVLDMGCGSGILSIMAIKMFGSRVIAADISRKALHATQTNAQLNHVEAHLETLHSDGFTNVEIAHHAPYDLILYNILAEPAIRHARDAQHVLAVDGLLMLSGILQWQVPAVSEAYHLLGFSLIAQARHEPWETLVFTQNSQ